MGITLINRGMMCFVNELFRNVPIVGAEVGVLNGENALNILQNMPNITLLYLIDPYEVYAEYLGDDAREIKGAKDIALQKLAPFQNRIRWVYKKFEECSEQEIDQPLDFIYIDGNHAYEFVKKDIELSVRLVKKGGVIGGHDAGAPSVDKAYREYCEKENIFFMTPPGTKNDAGWDWLFINEKEDV